MDKRYLEQFRLKGPSVGGAEIENRTKPRRGGIHAVKAASLAEYAHHRLRELAFFVRRRRSSTDLAS